MLRTSVWKWSFKPNGNRFFKTFKLLSCARKGRPLHIQFIYLERKFVQSFIGNIRKQQFVLSKWIENSVKHEYMFGCDWANCFSHFFLVLLSLLLKNCCFFEYQICRKSSWIITEMFAIFQLYMHTHIHIYLMSDSFDIYFWICSRYAYIPTYINISSYAFGWRKVRQTGENCKCVYNKNLYDLDIKGRWRQLAIQNRSNNLLLFFWINVYKCVFGWFESPSMECRAIIRTSPSSKCAIHSICTSHFAIAYVWIEVCKMYSMKTACFVLELPNAIALNV